MRVGDTEISDLRVGDGQALRAYQGDTLVWQPSTGGGGTDTSFLYTATDAVPGAFLYMLFSGWEPGA